MIWAGPGYPPQIVAEQNPALNSHTIRTRRLSVHPAAIAYFYVLGNPLQQCRTSRPSLSDQPRYLKTMLALSNASGLLTLTPLCQLSASNASRSSHIDYGKIARGQKINSEWMSTIRRQCARFTIGQQRSTRQLGEPVG